MERHIQAGKQATGRRGMDLWHILALGVVRLALDCDYDWIEYLVHYDMLMRQIMGLEARFEGEFGNGFHKKTIQDNIRLIDETLLETMKIMQHSFCKSASTEKRVRA